MSWGSILCVSWYGEESNIASLPVPPWPSCGGTPQLNAPTSFTATATSDTEISLSWSSDPNATTNILERDTDPLFSAPTTVYSGALETFDDSGLTLETTYYYRVYSTAAGYLDSAYANANATTFGVLADPTNFVVTTISDTEIDLDWDDVVNATSYTLQRDTDPLFGTATTIYTGATSSYSDTGLTEGTTYYYRVKATASGFVDSGWVSNNSTTYLFFPGGLYLDNISTGQVRTAYAEVLLTTTYSGSWARIKRTVDNLETDIGFCQGFVHMQAIRDFCLSSDGVIVTRYDQSGNGYDITGDDIKIYDGTTQEVLLDDNGNVAMKGDPSVNAVLVRADGTMPSLLANNDAFAISVVNAKGSDLSGNKTWMGDIHTSRLSKGFYSTAAGGFTGNGWGVFVNDGTANNLGVNMGSSPVNRVAVYSTNYQSDLLADVDIYEDTTSLTVIDGGSFSGNNGVNVFGIFGSSAGYIEGYMPLYIDFHEAPNATDMDYLRSAITADFVTNGNINDTTYDQPCEVPAPDSPVYTAWTNEANSNTWTVPGNDYADLYKTLFANLSYYGIVPAAYYGLRNDGSKEFSFINAYDPTGAKMTDAGHAGSWVSGQGYDTLGTGYIDVNRTMASFTTHAQNDASIFILARSLSGDDGYIFGVFDGTNTTELKDTTGGVTYAINGTVISTTSSLADGVMEVSRGLSTEAVLVVNGVVEDVGSNTSTAVPTANLYLGAKNNNGSVTGITDCIIDHVLITPNENANSAIIRALLVNFNNDASLI